MSGGHSDTLIGPYPHHQRRADKVRPPLRGTPSMSSNDLVTDDDLWSHHMADNGQIENCRLLPDLDCSYKPSTSSRGWVRTRAGPTVLPAPILPSTPNLAVQLPTEEASRFMRSMSPASVLFAESVISTFFLSLEFSNIDSMHARYPIEW